MTRERKENITVYSAVSMLVFGCVLTTIAFFIEPMGEIHDSVLWVLGQCFIYAGGALGIANYARSAARHEVDERFHDYERRHRHHHVADDNPLSDEMQEDPFDGDDQP